MIRYSPGGEFWAEPLAALRRIQDEINRAFGEYGAPETSESPPINIWRGQDGVIVTAEVPGVPIADIELTVHQNTLTIKGLRHAEAKEPEVSFHRRERVYGSFARTIALPFNVDPDRVRASCENGILTIELPRPETEKPKKIHIAKG
jgi:HSP20 family protein